MRQDVKNALKKYKIITLGVKGIIADAQKILADAEQVEFASMANMTILKTSTGESHTYRCVFFITDNRVVIRVYRLSKDSICIINYDDITEINAEKCSAMGGRITIVTEKRVYNVKINSSKYAGTYQDVLSILEEKTKLGGL